MAQMKKDFQRVLNDDAGESDRRPTLPPHDSFLLQCTVTAAAPLPLLQLPCLAAPALQSVALPNNPS
jgi:hypothetical protein